MNPYQDVKRRGRMFAFFGIGIAGLLGAWQLAAATPPEGARSLTVPILFVVLSIFCFAIAITMALNLRKET